MGVLSNKIGREELKAGDHIYSWRLAYIYAHHGIYMGDEMVIHFTRAAGQEIGTGTVLNRLLVCSSPSHDNPCLKCGDQSRLEGVISSCLDCFLSGGDLYLFKYDANPVFFLAEVRGGTCTLAKSDPPEDVRRRALFLLENGFGDYNVFKNNCEDFAIYCKTGLSIIVGRSGQAASYSAAVELVNNVVSSPLVNAVVSSPLVTTVVSSPLVTTVVSSSGVAVVGLGIYCIRRLVTDIGVRSDVSKVPVERLINPSG